MRSKHTTVQSVAAECRRNAAMPYFITQRRLANATVNDAPLNRADDRDSVIKSSPAKVGPSSCVDYQRV